MRICNEPIPRNGGKNCDENKAIEILNCEVNGGWTNWSSWSSCNEGQATNCEQLTSSVTSKTHIEPAIRTRTRTCTNPEPKNNGRLCVGLDREEEICTLEMINPCYILLNNNNNVLNSINNQMDKWTNWGPWSACSRICGEGFQIRRRTCNGKFCIGCNQEWRTCNSDICKEKVESIITDWDQIEIYKEKTSQKIEKRFKFMCKYDDFTEGNNAMELNSTIEYRICKDDKFCKSIKNLKDLNNWSIWSDWSVCKNCFDVKIRTRICNSINDCYGHEKEERQCDCTKIKKEDHGFSCWSDWTDCSANCGKGVHKRTRKCLNDNCIGLKEEISTCFNTNCSGLSSKIYFYFNLYKIASLKILICYNPMF
jgi:semaphorin 5